MLFKPVALLFALAMPVGAILFAVAPAPAQSAFPLRPDDAHAVYLDSKEFGAHGDGLADDSDALQKAINKVQDTVHRGVVFLPEGRYLLDRTVYVWAGIRLIGYGAKRPVLIRGQQLQGQELQGQQPMPSTATGEREKPLPSSATLLVKTVESRKPYMLWFTDERAPTDGFISDASEFTFYSGVNNIDFDLSNGDAHAVAIRFNVAQHGILTHANFQLGLSRAAIEAVGNQASDIHITGGQYGIITGKTSPAWQFLLMDSTFDGQKTAAIQTHDAGFTLIRDRFVNTATAIEIPDGEVEQLYGRDLRMEHISRSVLHAGNVRNLRSEITLENVVCSDVARFATGIDGVHSKDAPFARSPSFVEKRFSLGLAISSDGREAGLALHHAEAPMQGSPIHLRTDIPALPPMTTWVNVHALGAKGDGSADDTEVLQRAIDDHTALYFPSGWYRLTGSLHLRPKTTLIGFSPISTQLVLDDSDPHFQGSGLALPLLVAPHDGTNIVTGLGIATGNNNPRAAGIEWLAGSRSMIEDVDFFRGHSAFVAALTPGLTPKLTPAPQPDAAKRAPMQLDAQYASLWIHDGGGGILRGIWSPAGQAKAGLFIENTSTQGTIYQFSCEHHMRVEVQFDHAANWRVYDLQTEEEKPEGAEAVAMRIDSSHDLTFANTYIYRVSRNVMPMPYAVIAHDSKAIAFENVKVFSQTRLAFDNSIFDEGSEVAVRAHDFTQFDLTSTVHRPQPLPFSPIFAANAKLERVATGFSNASGLTADDNGEVYFSDAVNHTIYRYRASTSDQPEQPGHQNNMNNMNNQPYRPAEVLAKVEGTPMVLGFVAPSTLLVVNNEKSVSSIDTQSGAVTGVVESQVLRPSTALMLPTGIHNDLRTLEHLLARRGYIYRAGSNTALRSELIPEHRGYYYAPDAPGEAVAILAGGTWRPLLQSAQLQVFRLSESHYLISEDDARTFTGRLMPGPDASAGASGSLKTELFAERGGTSVVSDAEGNVLIAGGQVFLYDHSGKSVGVLEVPERPTSLCIGGANHRTLFIGARSSLYSIELATTSR